MTKYLSIALVTACSIYSADAKAEQFTTPMKSFMSGCTQALRQAKTDYNSKEIEMLCSDPYLRGTPDESAEDKALRMTLIKKTDEDKIRVMKRWVRSEDVIKPCFDAILANQPGKDLKDVKMLCLNPYLTPTPNESAADTERRKRLIEEAETAKSRMLDKYVVPAGQPAPVRVSR